MEFFAWIEWFTSDQGLMALLSDNWFTGLCIIALIIYLETVVIFLSFLPSDSLLVTVGVFVSTLGIPPVYAIGIISFAAILADGTTYALGVSRFGHETVREKWLKPHHVAKTEAFYAKYGGLSIILGRFFPVLRTLTPFFAGIIYMPFARYIMFSITGALFWCGGLIGFGMLISRFDVVKDSIAYLPLVLLFISAFAALIYIIRRFILRSI